MPRPAFATLLLCGLAVAAISAPEDVARGDAKALWIWGRQEPELVDYAVERGFDRLYLEVPAQDSRTDLVLRIAARAGAHGIATWAMNGHPEWATDHRPLARWVREVIGSPAAFAGIVLDIEPYTLPRWRDQGTRPTLVRQFLRGLRRARRQSGGLPVLAAIPFWFDHDGYTVDGRTLATAILSETDGVIVMAYRDRAEGQDGILRLAAGEVETAGAMGKIAMIGVQTAEDQLDKLTFFEEGRRELERQLDLVRTALGNEPGYGGLAIHHYSAYRKLHR